MNPAIINHPTYTTFDAENKNGKWGYMKFPSITAMVEFCRVNCTSPYSQSWQSSSWAGLGAQTCGDFYRTGTATEAKRLMGVAKGALPMRHTKLAQPHMAVTGGFWDTPSVLANLPLAARTRKRAKLAPLDLRIAFVLSAGISAEKLAPITARILRAVWEYIQAGGAVTLTVIDVGTYHGNGCTGFAVETKVNTSNVAELSIALHPLFSRLLGGPIQSEFFGASSISVPRSNPIKASHWIGGPMEQVIQNAAKVIRLLQID